MCTAGLATGLTTLAAGASTLGGAGVAKAQRRIAEAQLAYDKRLAEVTAGLAAGEARQREGGVLRAAAAAGLGGGSRPTIEARLVEVQRLRQRDLLASDRDRQSVERQRAELRLRRRGDALSLARGLLDFGSDIAKAASPSDPTKPPQES